MVDYQTATTDIADDLKQGGQTAVQRELWRLLRMLFKSSSFQSRFWVSGVNTLSVEVLGRSPTNYLEKD
jgi:hypothetical protein